MIFVPLIVSLLVSHAVSDSEPLYSLYFTRVITFIPCSLERVIMFSLLRKARNVRTFLSDHFQRFDKNLMDAGYCPLV